MCELRVFCFESGQKSYHTFCKKKSGTKNTKIGRIEIAFSDASIE